MANLIFEIDPKDITDKITAIKDTTENDVIKSVEHLAAMTHAKAHELARDHLSSLSQTYTDNLEFSNPSENLWIVILKNPAMWIEEGRKSGFMEELLNGKSSKTNKKGEKYAIIPFKHNANPTQQSPKAQALANEIKNEFKKRGIPWRNLEKDARGDPKIGKLHRFNVDSARLSDKHKSPATHGVAVYQTKNDKGQVRKDIMTFRIIHEKHREEGK